MEGRDCNPIQVALRFLHHKKVLREVLEILSQDESPGRDLKEGPPEHEADPTAISCG